MSKEQQLAELLLQSETELMVIVFVSAWSGGAHILRDKFNGILRDGYAFKLVCFDVEQGPELALKMNVSSVPTTILISNHEIVERFTGVHSRGKLLRIMGPYLPD